MKLGLENKKKTIVAAALAALALFMVVRAFTGGEDNAPPPPGANAPARTASVPGVTSTTTRTGAAAGRAKQHALLAQTLDPTLRFDLLKSSEDVTYKGSGRDIFRSQAPAPEIPKVVANPVQTQAPPSPPPPPPINLKLYGYVTRKNGEPKRVFLSSGEDIFVAKEGDIVNRRYRILKIGNNSVDVEDVLTNNKQTLFLQLS